MTGDTSVSDLAKILEKYLTIHIIISIAAMLVLSMVLTLAYACDTNAGMTSRMKECLRVYAWGCFLLKEN